MSRSPIGGVPLPMGWKHIKEGVPVLQRGPKAKASRPKDSMFWSDSHLPAMDSVAAVTPSQCVITNTRERFLAIYHGIAGVLHNALHRDSMNRAMDQTLYH